MCGFGQEDSIKLVRFLAIRPFFLTLPMRLLLPPASIKPHIFSLFIAIKILFSTMF